MAQLQQTVEKLKEFGIAPDDIQTQNLSVYQEQAPLYDPATSAERTRPGSWRVNNSVSIKLRDINKSSDLVALLSQGELTNVFGPRFTMDDTSRADNELLEQAVEDARKKAELLATAGGRTVTKVLSITESSAGSPFYPMMNRAADMGGEAVIEPGTQRISQSVTVVFEVK